MSDVVKPSQVSADPSLFDRFAERADHVISRSPWFALSFVFVLGWIVVGFFNANFSNDRFHLWLNSPTTAATFLMVGLAANQARRADKAVQHKLNAIADALAALMANPDGDLADHINELCEAVGLEQRESSQ